MLCGHVIGENAHLQRYIDKYWPANHKAEAQWIETWKCGKGNLLEFRDIFGKKGIEVSWN